MGLKANELRIGNWVQCDDGKSIVCGIEQDETFLNNGVQYRNDAIQPIPLTEEWLVKFGFKEIRRYTHDYEEVLYGKSIIKDSPNHSEKIVISLPFQHLYIGEFEIEEYYFANISVNYVHQLQNLYFALTNEELTWN